VEKGLWRGYGPVVRETDARVNEDRITGFMECKKKGDTNNNGGTGTITKLFRKYFINIRGKHEIRR